MKMLTEKWANIVDKDNVKMRSQMADYESQANHSDMMGIEQFVDRVCDLHNNYKIDALEVLSYVLSPLISGELVQAKCPIVTEGRSPLKGMSRDQVISLCNRHGLRTLEQLLQLIDMMQQAQRGNLNKNTNSS